MKHDTPRKEDAKPVPRPGQSDHSGTETNHGEGNPEAAAHFNKAEHEFVASKRGQEKIREAGNVRPEEQAALEEAERITRSPPIDSPPKVVLPKDGQR
jgi:hypothetical protein